MNRLAIACLVISFLITGLAQGQERTREGNPRGERPAGERQPAPRSEFPEEIKLTDEQQAKLGELRATFGAKFAALAKERDAILTDEQLKARGEVEQKIRAGGVSRQEIAELFANAVKLTPDQKTKTEAVEQAANKLRQEAEQAKLALLTSEQQSQLRAWNAERELARFFAVPDDIKLSDEQKTSLKALQDELSGELKTWTEKRNAIMTPERVAARDKVFKEAREGNKDRQAIGEALQAAVNLSDAERSDLTTAEQKLRELYEQIQTRKLGLLTPEQKQEFEKRFGTGRPRG
ncbi:MAG: hypothetical protein JNM18_21130 [Planctomycetaceae bacterium]|nr:hypothetical protein [Planctomycetaceae bacterium]